MRRKRGIQCNALGRSRGGFSTKINAVVDTKGRPTYVTLTPGNRHDIVAAPDLLEHSRGKVLVADTAYDSDEFIQAVRKKGKRPVIHPHPNRKKKHRLLRYFYRKRYLVEVFFHSLKRFRAIATRYEKTARNYLALVHLACATLWLPSS